MIFDTEVHTSREFDELLEWLAGVGYLLVPSAEKAQDHRAENMRTLIAAMRKRDDETA